MKSFLFRSLLCVYAGTACAPAPAAKLAPAPAPAQKVKYIPPETGLNNSGLDTSLVSKRDKVVKTSIEEAVAPGVAIAVGRNGHIAYMKGYGYIDWNQPGSPVVDTNTLYDLASLTSDGLKSDISRFLSAVTVYYGPAVELV